MGKDTVVAFISLITIIQPEDSILSTDTLQSVDTRFLLEIVVLFLHFLQLSLGVIFVYNHGRRQMSASERVDWWSADIVFV